MPIDTTACDGVLVQLFEHHGISPGARHEIKLYIKWYLNVALDLGPDTAAAFADATRLNAEARLIVAKAKNDLAAAAYVPPGFDETREMAIALEGVLQQLERRVLVPAPFDRLACISLDHDASPRLGQSRPVAGLA